GPVGPYQLQAAIALEHATAPTAAATDWSQIAALYGMLARLAPSPVVELNRAAAVGMAAGPEAGLALLEPLGDAGGVLAEHHLLHAARAELLRRAGRGFEAAAAYHRALELAPEEGTARPDLARRLRELRGAERDR
ncbi:MAG: polymerase sigma factor, partial [Solirubrobacterales bacterium]|nr:polymerase sigma factor [Solirubrobacterales bacterium]